VIHEHLENILLAAKHVELTYATKVATGRASSFFFDPKMSQLILTWPRA
jgi:hypothetical protein